MSETERRASRDDDKPARTREAQMARDTAALQAFGFKAMTGMGTVWTEMMSQMGSEVLSFVADRIRQDVKTQHQLLHCRDIEEARRIQAEFLRKAVDDYTAETGKLVEMSAEFMKAAGAGGKTNS